jgi:splicing factor 3A subunit 1
MSRDLAGGVVHVIRDDVGVMRDNLSLAHYNVLEDVQLTLGIKERGRGKK